MRVSRGPVTMAGVTAIAVAAAAAAVMTARAETGESPAAPERSTPRAVSLITGERVQVSQVAGRPVVVVEPSASGGRVSARTMTVADRAYVVPDAALPYLGHQLDLSLFDVTRPVRQVEVEWAGTDRHAIPGLKTESGSGAGAGSDATVSARVDSPEAFGAALAGAALARGALAADHAAADPLAGITKIRAANADGAANAGNPANAGDPTPTAQPQYPMATLVVHGINRDGAASISGSVAVDNIEDLQRYAGMQTFDAKGDATFSVPVGKYSIAAEVATVGTDGVLKATSLMFLPEVDVAAPRTVIEVDARTATNQMPIPKTPRAASLEQVTSTFGRSSANGLHAAISYMISSSSPTIFVTPTKPVTIGALHWYTYYRFNGKGEQGEQYVYDVQVPNEGTVPAELPTTVDASSLATVQAAYHSDVADQKIGTYRPSVMAWELMPIRFSSGAVAPMQRTEYVSARPDVRWTSGVIWQLAENNGVDLGPWRVLKAGEELSEAHLAAPLAPGVDADTTGSVPCGACRQGNELFLNIASWAGGNGRRVSGLNQTETLTVSNTSKLFADDEPVIEGKEPIGKLTIPATAKQLRLELASIKSGAWTTTSTTVQTVWKWGTSNRGANLPAQRTCADGSHDCAFEPLLFLDYDVPVSPTNGIPAGASTKIGILAQHQLYDTTAPPANALTFEVSGDDGANWSTVAVTPDGEGHFTANVVPAAGNGFLSFRVQASDPSGNSIAQTIVRAVRVAG